jgi:hypothetical protein
LGKIEFDVDVDGERGREGKGIKIIGPNYLL